MKRGDDNENDQVQLIVSDRSLKRKLRIQWEGGQVVEIFKVPVGRCYN